MPGKLAVIGGGPKGVAIAAKASALASSGYLVPEIHVFEEDEIGSAWTGRAGYTDGLQPLCTLAERDLGFPYDRSEFGPTTAHMMMALFSWQAFCVHQGTRDSEYAKWVQLGRQPPAHGEFARYLKFAFEVSDAKLWLGKVNHIQHHSTGVPWTVSWTDKSGIGMRDTFDAVVITGSGGPKPPLPGTDPGRVFDARAFWSHLQKIVSLLRAVPDPQLVIIGGGGAAAAIVHWFVRRDIREVPVQIVGSDATLYPRTAGYFVDRLFSDTDEWDLLPESAKDKFELRITRGVVWNDVLENLRGVDLSYTCGEIRTFRTVGSAGNSELQGALHDPSSATLVRYVPGTVFVDARGFDPLGFVNLFGAAKIGQDLVSASLAQLRAQVNPELELRSIAAGLHVPNLGGLVGPGAPNLMALGWVADRILRGYVNKRTPGVQLRLPGALS